MNSIESGIIISDIEHDRTVAFELLIKCPRLDKIDCPLREQRALSMREQFAWVSSLTRNELDEIDQSHQNCLLSQTACSSLGGVDGGISSKSMCHIAPQQSKS
ncbi:MAG: hypothetical protein V7752_08125 [Halopseudomonas sp.]